MFPSSNMDTEVNNEDIPKNITTDVSDEKSERSSISDQTTQTTYHQTRVKKKKKTKRCIPKITLMSKTFPRSKHLGFCIKQISEKKTNTIFISKNVVFDFFKKLNSLGNDERTSVDSIEL